LDVNLAIKQQKGKKPFRKVDLARGRISKTGSIDQKNNILWSVTGFE